MDESRNLVPNSNNQPTCPKKFYLNPRRVITFKTSKVYNKIDLIDYLENFKAYHKLFVHVD